MQKTAYEEQKATFEDSWVSLIACKKVIIIEKSGQTGNENVSSSHKPRIHLCGVYWWLLVWSQTYATMTVNELLKYHPHQESSKLS